MPRLRIPHKLRDHDEGQFNHHFLNFAAHYLFDPSACNIRSPHEKGRVENAAKYIKNKFLSGRTFSSLAASICEYGLIPGELLGTAAPGTKVPLGGGLACVLAPGAPAWSIITSMFMHGGWFHIIGNMWFLAVFGDNVEDALGSVRFILFYLLCGVAAAALQVVTDSRSVVPMVGASGAIGGVMGAYAVLFPRAPVHVLVFFGFYVSRFVVPAFLMLGYWFVIQILGGIPVLAGAGGGIAFWAHVGGFAAGVILSKVLYNPERVAALRDRKGRAERMMQRYR